MTADIERKLVWGMASTPDGPILTIGFPDGALQHLKEGETHTLDLTRIVGFPLRFLMYGGGTHDEVVQRITSDLAEKGIPVIDARREDFSIKTEGRDD